MKVRTCVMFACMTIVPALAMFSHQLPAGLRDAMRTRLWEPVEDWVASLTKREPTKTATASNKPTPIDSPVESPTEPVQGASPVPAKPVAIAASGPSSPSDALASLGATAIDCRPFDGLVGTHVASCRVAVDAGGELHRVFQAAGASPDEAFAALLDTVRSWKQRTATLSDSPRL
jgi:hypothetical protein